MSLLPLIYVVFGILCPDSRMAEAKFERWKFSIPFRSSFSSVNRPYRSL